MSKVAFVPQLDAKDDCLFTYAELGKRWSCHAKVAYQRVQDWGLPVVKFNTRAHAIRLSDILRAEAEAMT